MSVVIQIGELEINDEDLFPLLAQYRILPQLAKEVIIERAIANIECTNEEEKIARQRFYQQFQITTEAQIKLWLKHHGMTPEQLDRLVLREIKLEKYKQETWGNQVESQFLQSKRQLDRVVYSLIRSKDAGIAQELFFRIQEGETSFTELARKYSEGTEAETGGLIGPVELNVPHPKIAQMLSATRPGQLIPPTRVGDWWIVLRLEKYLSAQLDDQMRQRILNELFQAWLNAEYQQKVSYKSILY
ncbi:peptidylprolyl isomerase [Candidatus Gracilibacteria bacterium]|jgi:parvulin-like peptidyl-prolyl isomerase|nr:peptidylprolyl isomerase [Candidatus Gracilibacteria bacterium]NJM86574.1 peptidylprolyl isomerase [Hydrococcus sp. RU_2_2]NJP18885.1 peptidylprolyl isomerase [Hydrococcus sp. CRU_1_1]